MTRRNRRSGGGTRKASKTVARKRASTRRLPRKAATTRLIKQVLNRKLETKYCADQISLGGSPVKSSCSPNLDAITIIPDVVFQGAASGAASNLREGDEIEPIRATIRGHLWFNTADENQTAAKVVFVKMFILQSKQIKSEQFQAQMDGGWLENGTFNPVQWVASDQDLQAFYPVAKQNYTVLKTQTFKLVKNVGECIADVTAGNSPNTMADRKTFSYSWKPPKLKYADTNKTQPSNHYPFMVLVCYSPGQTIDLTNAELFQSVLYDFNREMYFKDA